MLDPNEIELKRRKKRLNLCIKFYQWVIRHLTEQMIFITNEKYLEKVQRDLERG